VLPNATNTALKKNFSFWSLGIVLIALLLYGCSNKGCYDDMSVKLYVHFYHTNTSGVTSAYSIDSMSVWGVGSDSLLYTNQVLSKLELDLNPNASQTQYVITALQNGQLFIDTLTLIHHNEPWFQSMECGCRVFSTLEGCRVSGVIFKSAVIQDSAVINYTSEHVKLYL
jgi:hypothetical protein